MGLLRDAAEAGVRCPTNPEITKILGRLPFECTPTELARKGLITVEVYGKNWRVVEIDGKRTMEAPSGGRPYLINGVKQGHAAVLR